MKSTFIPPAWPQPLVEMIQALKPYETRLVGGAVRALLEGTYTNVQDQDAATTATPHQATEILENLGAKVIPTGIDHGTLTVIYQSFHLELTTLRQDVATNGRHAQVAFTTSWEEDSARRDFTINAIYAGLAGTFYDFQHGLEDFQNHRLRFVGDAATRVQEDSLRILRYLRFMAQLGWEEDANATLTELTPYFSYMQKLSAERITQELKKWVNGPHYCTTLPYLQKYKMLEPLGLQLQKTSLPNSPYLPTCIKLERLLTGWERLTFSNQERKLIHQTRQAEEALAEDPPLAVAVQYSQPATLVAMALAGETAETCSTFATHPLPTFPLTGQDVLDFGISPSPQVGNLLQQTHQWWLTHNFPNRESCLTHLTTLL